MKYQVSSSALFEQMENVHKRLLTPDQDELIRHQDEVLKSINTISEYLQMYSDIYYEGKVKADTLANLHYVRKSRIDDASHAFKNYFRYAECRRRLVSTEKEYDVDFVWGPLQKAIDLSDSVLQRMEEARLHELRFHEIEAMGVDRQQIATQMRELKEVVYTIKDKLQEINSEYEELYEDIYHCSAEDSQARFNRQFDSVTGIHHVIGNYINLVSIDCLFKSITRCNKTKFPTPWGDMVIDFSKPIKIKTAKDTLVDNIISELPFLEENDLCDPANMANKLRDHHISFTQTNQMMLGFTCFHLLDRISQGQTIPETAKHRGRPEVNMYDYISKESLMASFPSYREEANKALEAETGTEIKLRWNEFSALYLIALAGDAINKIKGLAAGFVRCLNNLFSNLLNLNICKDTVQNHIKKFFEYLRISPNDYDRFEGKRDYQAARWRMIIPMLRSWFQRDSIHFAAI